MSPTAIVCWDHASGHTWLMDVVEGVRVITPYIIPKDPRRVYFLLDEEEGQVKIGYSQNVPIRIREISSKLGRTLRLLATTPGGCATERVFHTEWAGQRNNGEWFEYSGGLVDAIESIARERL